MGGVIMMPCQENAYDKAKEGEAKPLCKREDVTDAVLQKFSDWPVSAAAPVEAAPAEPVTTPAE